jgi:hypothetical protein
MPETATVPKKIIVAVHGIGDQVRCTTIQEVANQFCKYFGVAGAIPLGRLNAELVELEDDANPPAGVCMIQSPPDPRLPGQLGFAEVYWADIPRRRVHKGFFLEEPKAWGRTVVERVRANDIARHGKQTKSQADYQLATIAIQEIIEMANVTEHLLLLAKLGHVPFLRDFQLRKLLDDYLGDVQFVTEFRNLRQRILQVFHKVMSRIHEQHPSAELYLVAHSEGSVLALLGILGALCQSKEQLSKQQKETAFQWVRQLRGLMTIGSPIDKHLLLWPELWRTLHAPAPPADKDFQPIQWRNYYDLGDPIGFQLDTAQEWLGKTGWDRYFDFDVSKGHDIGFSRYPFPGAAHNRYWSDPAVFGHFIGEVVRPNPGELKPKKYVAPRSQLRGIFSPAWLYVAASALLLLGVFFLYKAVTSGTLPFSETPGEIAQNVAAIFVLLAGVTVATRIPRLTKLFLWRLTGAIVFILSLLAFPLLLTCEGKERFIFVFSEGYPGVRETIQATFRPVSAFIVSGPITPLSTWAEWSFACSGSDHEQQLIYRVSAMLFILAVVTAAVLLICVLNRLWPASGVKPLIAIGMVIILTFVLVRLLIWPQFIDYHQSLRENMGPDSPPLATSARKTLELANDRVSQKRDSQKEPPRFTEFLKTDAARNKVPHLRIEKSPPKDKEDELPNGLQKFKKSQPPNQATAVAPSDSEAQSEVEQNRFTPLWPLLLAGLAFLYLWWAAALAFDLAVTWQLYVRRGQVMSVLKELSPEFEASETPVSGAQATNK